MLYSDALYYAERGYKVRRACWRPGEYAEGARNEAGFFLRYVVDVTSHGDRTATDWGILPKEQMP